MKYILMCGGNYQDKFEVPKPLLEVNGEILIERTIRLLKENGVTDIAISTNDLAYEYLGVELLKHKNDYIHDNPDRHKKSKNSWLNAYYPIDTPACYLAGDVYYSEEALKTIIKTDVKTTMFFVVPDVQDGRKSLNIKGREPLAYKVQNQKVFRKAINELLEMIDAGLFRSDPISWNLYRKINGIKLDFNGYGNDIFKTHGDFIPIDDYTTDIDKVEDIQKLEKLLNREVAKMIKVKVIKEFHLGKFDELKNIIRASAKNTKGYLYVGDTFECTEDMYKYLSTGNGKGTFVELMEIIPEKEEIEDIKIIAESIKESKTTKRTRKKKVEE